MRRSSRKSKRIEFLYTILILLIMEIKDYNDEVRLHRSRLVRFLLFITGSISLALGIIGIFTPILPTTPFLLLSAACYARASHRFYNWLMNNRYFGSYIRDWRIHKMIPLRAKILAISMIFLTIGTTVFFFIPILAVKILVSLIGIFVVIYLIRIPTKRKN
ncbi:YbaN family protein [Leptospira interrogans]|uniref:YbaN family protein n=1 Tax=Leptospira interrogans TaxID=173 RepID=UPI0002B96618|nr:YbaN family protein [Leptospira interrogans]